MLILQNKIYRNIIYKLLIYFINYSELLLINEIN